MKRKIIRITTVPVSLSVLLKGQLRFMNDHYTVVGISSPGPSLDKVNSEENVPVYAVSMTRRISPLRDLLAAWSLYKIFRHERPFIVHTHTPKAGTVGMIAARMAGVPHRLHTIAGLPLLESRGLKRIILNFVEKLTYSCASKLYPNSKGLCEIIVNNKFARASKLKVIGYGSSNGIDTSYFDPEQIDERVCLSLKADLMVNPLDFVYLFVGRLVGDKGINELVDSFIQVNCVERNTKLILVGPLESNLDPLKQSTLDAIHTNKSIISVGFQKDVRPFFAISDVFVFPSYREGFPNVVMQAGAMGVPSIVSDINGCNEIIDDGVNGFIVPVKNTLKLKDTMLTCLERQAKLTDMKLRCREHIRSRYEREFVWKEILEEYKSL